MLVYVSCSKSLPFRNCARSFVENFTDWKFITPHRMVGLLKSILKKTFGRQLVKENEFSDVIYQAERILNSRPITEVTSEPSRVLRPVDFLNPTISQNKEEIKVGKEVEAIEFIEDAEVLVRRKNKLEQASNELWSVWHHEYLRYLREITLRNNKKGKLSRIREPYIDEVVLLEKENVPQQLWRLARMVRIEKNTQGRISGVVLRVSRNKLRDKVSYITRPLECRNSKSKTTVRERSKSKQSGPPALKRNRQNLFSHASKKICRTDTYI
uniref:DUF5641 domain-containing protein n=1 Tax=Syphacia muris TaxID=451379 RepID=A0A0N5ABQ1_9BILA